MCMILAESRFRFKTGHDTLKQVYQSKTPLSLLKSQRGLHQIMIIQLVQKDCYTY